jgi:UPF0755 protein
VANEPSWDDIFRPAGGEPVRPEGPVTPPASPEPTVPGYSNVRASDPFAVAAAEAQTGYGASAQSAAGGSSEPMTRRQVRELEEQQASRGGNGGGRTPTSRDREPKPKKKRRGLIAVAIILVSVLALGSGAAAFVWINYETKVRELLGWELPNDYAGTGNGKEVIVTIAANDIGEDVARVLHQKGVTMSFDAVYDYLLLPENADIVFFPGSFRLQEQMSAEAAVAAVTDPANQIVNQVLITEGMSYPAALDQIAAATEIPIADLQEAAADYTSFGIPADAPNIEGWMFPAKYTFDPGVTAHDAIQTTVDKMFEVLDGLGVAPEDRLNVLKMASLVQRESGPNVEDMGKIARVFYNRLDQDMLFQSDATVAYGTGNTHTVWTTPEERADPNNLYNTYFHKGLPYGPIGLPGEDALKAAISPTEGPWLFFVPINLATGETVFSETADQHEAAAQQLYAWCRASDENASYCE